MAVTPVSEPLELTIITGLSGAGRGEAARSLEDLGWFVVDNLPPALLVTMADLADRSAGGLTRVAVVVDVRGRAFFNDLRQGLDELASKGVHRRVLYLEANDDVLVRRFEHSRRPHPLAGNGRIVDGIAQERALLAELRGEADLVIDTSTTNVHELRAKLADAFAAMEDRRLRASVVSFGYKHGLPVDADLVVDCRFLPNPHWDTELRPFSGRDEVIRDFVLRQAGAQEFLEAYTGILGLLIEGFLREGKRYLTLAVGCTGGRHRSVVIADELAGRLEAAGADVRVTHRDVGRE